MTRVSQATLSIQGWATNESRLPNVERLKLERLDKLEFSQRGDLIRGDVRKEFQEVIVLYAMKLIKMLV